MIRWVHSLALVSLLIVATPAAAQSPYAVSEWATPGYSISIAVSSVGEVYVHNLTTAQISVYSSAGSLVRTISETSACSNGLQGASTLAFGPNDELYVHGIGCNVVVRMDTLGNVLGSFSTVGARPHPSEYADIAVDGSGNIYLDISQPSQNVAAIAKLSPAGAPMDTIVLDFTYQSGSGLAIDEDGNLWAAGSFLHKIDSNGNLVGSFQYQENSVPVPLYSSYGLACDRAGHVFASDGYTSGSVKVAEITTAGASVRGWAAWTESFPGSHAGIQNDVAATPNGYLYVLEPGRVIRFAMDTTPAASAEFDGITNTATGGALVSTRGDLLVVSNIGSSGNDGVSFPASAPDEGRGIDFHGALPVDPAVDQGGRIVAEMVGTANGDPVSLGRITLDVVANGIDITPDFTDLESSEIHVEAYQGSVRVHSCQVPNASVLHRSGTTLSNEIQAAGDGIGGVDVGLKKKPGGQLQQSIVFSGGKSVNIGGTQVVADKLVFSAASPRQPLTAVTTVLKVKAPATLAAAHPGAVITASNLGEVVIRGEPALVDSMGASSGGIRMEPKGSSSFGGSPTGDGATVVGIGSSGNDGIDVVVDKSTGSSIKFGDRMGFNTATDAGAFLEKRTRGKVGCVPDSTIAVVTETVYPDSIVLRADFSKIGATGVKIAILDQGAVVHAGTYPPTQSVRLVEVLAGPGNSTTAASINTSRSNLKDKASIASSGVKVTTAYKRPGAGTGPQILADPMPFDMMIGATRYQGDEVSFEAVGATLVTEITGTSLRQKNPGVASLDSMRFARGGLDVGSSGATNESKGQAYLTAAGGKLVAHNIGSSGNDGVKVRAEKPSAETLLRLSRIKQASEQAAGARMKLTARGKRTGNPAEQDVLPVQAEKVGSKLRMGPLDLGSHAHRVGSDAAATTTHRLQVLMNGTVVATLDALNPQADFDRMPDQVRHLASGPVFVASWDAPLLISIVGGASAVGNGMRILPLGQPDDVEALSAVDIAAADIPSFEIGDWATPLVGVEPAPGIASRASLKLSRNPVLGGGVLEMSVSIPEAGTVQLDLFDPQGRRMASVFKGRQTAGVTSYRWAPARATSSGIYFVRMKAGGVESSHKVVFVQ